MYLQESPRAIYVFESAARQYLGLLKLIYLFIYLQKPCYAV